MIFRPATYHLVLALFLALSCAKDNPPEPASPVAPPSKEDSMGDKASNLQSMAEALAFTKPQMSDEQNKTSPGAIALAAWAATHMKLSDVLVSKDETSFALVQKDPDEERGKRLCYGGTIVQIEVKKTKHGKTYDGILTTKDGDLLKFLSVGSSGSLVERSWARICGVVVGKYDYSNSGGGVGHAVQLVGIFDLPENRLAEVAARVDQAAFDYSQKRTAKLAELREVLKREPENRDAQMSLVDLYLSMGRYAEAEKMLDEAIAKDANDLQTLSREGILKSRMGRPNEALKPLEKVASQSPLMFDARAEYAFLLFRGDPTNADRCIRTLTDILTSEPRNVLSRHYLGMCLYAKGNKPRAEDSFKAALRVDPIFAAAHFSLGELYENDNKIDAAKTEYEAAANLNHIEARDALMRLTSRK